MAKLLNYSYNHALITIIELLNLFRDQKAFEDILDFRYKVHVQYFQCISRRSVEM